MDREGPSRREFLEMLTRLGLSAGGAGLLAACPGLGRLTGLAPEEAYAAESLDALIKHAPAARYWISSAHEGASCTTCHEAADIKGRKKFRHSPAAVKCLLCAHECLIADGERGRCRTRVNVGGTLRTLVYGRPISEHVDPIEKKPFYHFLPGSEAYSLATSGCPLRCQFCQNWEISQASPEDYHVSYRSAEDMALRARSRKAPVVAFTYNEPTVFTEYLTDIAREARALGLRSVIISCGFMNEDPLREMIDVLDAFKIDLKGYSEEFYRKVTKSELGPVLRSIRQIASAGKHLELVNLVVPTLNDSRKDLTDLCKWVAGELGPDVPVHFTRFHPDFRLLNLPPTPVSTLEKAREIAMEQGIRYAFVGNVPGHPGNHTYCHACGKILIERKGFFVVDEHIRNGRCGHCKAPVAGVWK